MYCPNGTRYANEHKCPRGTYNNKTGLQIIEQCTPCAAGFYCDEEGQTTFTKKCSPGKLESFLVCFLYWKHSECYFSKYIWSRDNFIIKPILSEFQFLWDRYVLEFRQSNSYSYLICKNYSWILLCTKEGQSTVNRMLSYLFFYSFLQGIIVEVVLTFQLLKSTRLLGCPKS